MFGRYLFGAQWQEPLRQRLGVSRRLIVYWAGAKRPISRRYSERIVELVAAQHARRRSSERSAYLAMIAAIASASARTLMLSLLAAEVEVRAEAITLLAGNGVIAEARAAATQRDERAGEGAGAATAE